jgi:hypothetical protein
MYRRLNYGSLATYAAHVNASEEEEIALSVALRGMGVSARIRYREQVEAEQINLGYVQDNPEQELNF